MVHEDSDDDDKDDSGEVSNSRIRIWALAVLMMRWSAGNGDVGWIRNPQVKHRLGDVVGELSHPSESGEALSVGEKSRLYGDLVAEALSTGKVSRVKNFVEKSLEVVLNSHDRMATGSAVDATGVSELREIFYVATGEVTPGDRCLRGNTMEGIPE